VTHQHDEPIIGMWARLTPLKPPLHLPSRQRAKH